MLNKADISVDPGAGLTLGSHGGTLAPHSWRDTPHIRHSSAGCIRNQTDILGHMTSPNTTGIRRFLLA